MKKPSSDEYYKRTMIKGATTIIHSIRVNLKLSLEEYVLLSFIDGWNEKKKEVATFRDFYIATGIMPEDTKAYLNHMKKRKLIVFNEEAKRIDVCNEWKHSFGSSDLVEILWKIHAKGNKKTAAARLPKVLKKIPFEELKAKYITYIKSVSTSEFRHRKGLDVFLNPDKEHWNDPIAGDTRLKNENKPKPSRFKT